MRSRSCVPWLRTNYCARFSIPARERCAGYRMMREDGRRRRQLPAAGPCTPALIVGSGGRAFDPCGGGTLDSRSCAKGVPGRIDSDPWLMHGAQMATKTISIETDVYDLLAREKRAPHESFSRVIRRLF